MAMFRRSELVEWFKMRGVQPSNAALLIGAIIGRHEEQACRLISSGAAASGIHSGASPLHWAARYCLPTVVNALLDLRIDINSRSSNGDTPLGECLSFAAGRAIDHANWEETTRILLKRGASVVNVDSRGNPAIFVGLMLWYSSVADELMHASLGMRGADGRTVLMAASERGSAQHVQNLIKRGVDIDESDKKGRTALFECCGTIRDSLEKLEIVLNAGAAPDTRDSAGETPLFEAARRKDVAVIKCLLDAAADVDATNLEGETPLFISARNNYPENVRCLLQAGANADIRNRSGLRAMDNALQTQNPDLINLFLKP
jgi:ankyrin repeat protein